MSKKLLALIGAVAFGASASVAQAHTKPSLATVLSHTRAADVALDRAVTNFNKRAVSAGRSNLAQNRSQMGKAVAEQAQLIRDAETPAARLAAAKAVVAIARQGVTNETALARVARALPRGSKAEVAVLRAAKADAARTVALAKLAELLPSVPEQARPGITRAIAAITLAHAPAVDQLRRDVTSARVGRTAKEIAAAAIVADLRGQARAVELLQALKPLLPAEAQDGVDAALAAIASSLEAQAEALAAAKEHAPAGVAETVEAAAAAAGAAASNAGRRP